MIFLLKKNIRIDIIKMILEYLLIVASETLREWKVAITSVGQEYKSTESQYDYRTRIGITYEARDVPIDIRKTKDNFNKDGRPRYFKCNTYRYIAKEYKKLKKECNTKKCYKYNKVEHIAKNCRFGQKIKNQSDQKELDEEDNNKQKNFAEDLKQA